MKKYGMKLRGCSIGCQPKGFVKFEDTNKEETGYWSILYYDRELTEEEIEEYDLEEIKENDIEKLNEILQGSKRFEFQNGENGMTVLKITGYYTGKSIKLDLSKLTEEMLEELIVEEGEDYEF